MQPEQDVKEKKIDLTETLVQYKTVTGKMDAIDACIEEIIDFFPSSFTIKQFEQNGVPSLIISPGTTDSYDILLHGHIEVVPAPGNMFKATRDDEKLYGRGVADMKGGLACLMHALRDAGKDASSHGLLVTADEEKGGPDGAQYHFRERELSPSFALTAEPNPYTQSFSICTAQKGIARLTVTADGESAHAARNWNGMNAIDELIDAYNDIRPLFHDDMDWRNTVNVGSITGGGATNKVPASASLELDLRTVDETIVDTVIDRLEAHDSITATLETEDPTLETSITNDYVQQLQAICENVTGTSVTFTREPVASDLRFASEQGIPAVKFGPRGAEAHSVDEHLDLSSIEPYYHTIKRFLTQ